MNGFLIEPRNAARLSEALKRLIDDKQLRLRMGKASREKAEREFSIEKVIGTHLDIYRKLSGID